MLLGGEGFRCHLRLLRRRTVPPRLVVALRLRREMEQEYLVEREGERCQGALPQGGLQLAFPDDDAVPPHCGEAALHLLVALLVAPYLAHPEVAVGLRNLAALAVGDWRFAVRWWERHMVPVPEAAVHEDARPVFP